MTTTISSEPATFENRRSKVSVPVLGVGDRIGEGDTYLVENVLPPELAEVAFEDLMKEVAWNVMHHRGPSCSHVLKNASDPDIRRATTSLGGEVPRLVAVEGEIDADGR